MQCIDYRILVQYCMALVGRACGHDVDAIMVSASGVPVLVPRGE